MGTSNGGVSGEYRIPASEVSETIIALDNFATGGDADVPGDARGVVRIGPYRGRITEDLVKEIETLIVNWQKI